MVLQFSSKNIESIDSTQSLQRQKGNKGILLCLAIYMVNNNKNTLFCN